MMMSSSSTPSCCAEANILSWSLLLVLAGCFLLVAHTKHRRGESGAGRALGVAALQTALGLSSRDGTGLRAEWLIDDVIFLSRSPILMLNFVFWGHCNLSTCFLAGPVLLSAPSLIGPGLTWKEAVSWGYGSRKERCICPESEDAAGILLLHPPSLGSDCPSCTAHSPPFPG